MQGSSESQIIDHKRRRHSEKQYSTLGQSQDRVRVSIEMLKNTRNSIGTQIDSV